MSISSDRRTKEARELRERILEAAGQILRQDGLEGLSVRRLAEAIGHTTGTIYHHFRDKEEILSSLVAQGRERISALVTPLSEAADPRTALKDNLMGYTRMMLGQRSLFRALFLGPGTDPASMLDSPVSAGTPLDGLARFFGDQVARGRFRDLDPDLTARLVWTAWNGLLVRLIREDVTDPQKIDYYGGELFDLLWRGLEPRPAP